MPYDRYVSERGQNFRYSIMLKEQRGGVQNDSLLKMLDTEETDAYIGI